MAADLTFTQYIDDYAERGHEHQAVAAALNGFVTASIEISELVGRGALAGITGRHQGTNADGDQQKDLDILADQIIRRALQTVSYAALLSEEAAEPEFKKPGASILLAYDPLDGSSNIETNTAVGTIFSVLPNRADQQPFTAPGRDQVAAGFVVYGPQTALVLTLGEGVTIFILDRGLRNYILVKNSISIPISAPEYAINASNQRHWEPAVRAFIDECMAGTGGPLGQAFNMRWTASLVAEAYRILMRGGIFLYPSDAREGYSEGRLRLLYEAHPIAYIIEQAGGAASTGRQRILDLSSRHPHQRVPLIMGSKNEVDYLSRKFKAT
jgi:fructose-1,6-bisphosphatase I